MTKVLEFERGEASVQIVVDDGGIGASQKAGVGPLGGVEQVKARLPLEEATQIVGKLAESFSAALANAAVKPNTVEVAFGLEASGELGNFLVSKVTGKTNFSVKLSWKFD